MALAGMCRLAPALHTHLVHPGLEVSPVAVHLGLEVALVAAVLVLVGLGKAAASLNLEEVAETGNS